MSLPGTRFARKLDAIDTDQITPAADCVSESLDTLDERWKAGSFRYLMPDFRARVHRGETFVIAGDRFAIGSSREMSPAGLKGVAEEAGLEMVIVCGNNMGDIFRRNALNLGLHVVQSPEAVADARDGDEFSFDPGHAAADATRRRARPTTPVPLTPKEDEIRRSGGIFAVGRREFRASVADARRRSSGPIRERARADDDDRADRLGASRRQGSRASCAPGATLRVYADLLPASDGTAPFAIHTFNQITGGNTIYPAPGGDRQRSLRLHRQATTTTSRPAIGREFARAARHREAVLRDAGRRHLPLLLSRAGAGAARAVHSRRRLAQPRLRRLRRGRHRRRIDDARVRLVDRLHLLHAARSSGASSFSGRLQPWVSGKDIVLELLRRWGAKQSQGMSVELVDADRQLPIAYRNTIANMMAEAEALNGIFAPDDITYAWYRAKGIDRAAVSAVRARRRRASTTIDETLDLADVRADDRQAVQPRQRVSRPRRSRASGITFDKAMIGSCTNGSYDDLLQAALVLRAARERGREERRARVRGLSRVGRRRPPDRAARSAARRRIDRRGVPLGRRRDPPVVVRPVLRPGAGRARRRASARSRRSTATGRTAWASAAKAISPAPPSSPRRRCSATWRRRPSSGSSGTPRNSACDVADCFALTLVVLSTWRLDGVADRPADLDCARDADVPRNRPRRRQHHLHLDPVGEAARATSSRARAGSACSARW